MARKVVLILALHCILPSFSAPKDNVALNASVTAVAGRNSPSLANDGRVGESSLANCFHSAVDAQYYPGWWRVDLGAVYPLDDIIIHFLFIVDGFDLSSGTAVYVQNITGSKELCTTINEFLLEVERVSCPQRGQILELRKTATASAQYIALCEVQVFVAVPDCPSNTYRTGVACTLCGHCLNGAVCDKTNGACTAGCDLGWTGTRCDTECSSGCQLRTCSQTIGDCTGGCVSGLWGPKCDQQCSSGCQQSICNQTTGDCTGGCVSGRWGPKCDQQCSATCAEVSCDRSSAACTGGCKDGWRGSTCNETCEAGRFGAGCTGVCGHCPCHPVTGACTGACDSGWERPSCNQTCSAGRYGTNCSNTCGRCRDNAACNHVTGNCPAGCEAGWDGLRCLQECHDGTYGEGCTLTCGQCAGGVACDKKYGFCAACQEGFTPPLCQQDIASEYGSAYNQGLGTGVGIGIGVSCLVALIILAIVCIWHRRNQSQGSGRSKQHGRQSGEIRNADSSVYYNTAQEVAEAGDKAPYESLDAATRNANLPSHYEEIGNNRGRL